MKAKLRLGALRFAAHFHFGGLLLPVFIPCYLILSHLLLFNNKKIGITELVFELLSLKAKLSGVSHRLYSE